MHKPSGGSGSKSEIEETQLDGYKEYGGAIEHAEP
jgi:hypothetical protein